MLVRPYRFRHEFGAGDALTNANRYLIGRSTSSGWKRGFEAHGEAGLAGLRIPLKMTGCSAGT
jgi:hypothetical protein